MQGQESRERERERDRERDRDGRERYGPYNGTRPPLYPSRHSYDDDDRRYSARPYSTHSSASVPPPDHPSSSSSLNNGDQREYPRHPYRDFTNRYDSPREGGSSNPRDLRDGSRSPVSSAIPRWKASPGHSFQGSRSGPYTPERRERERESFRTDFDPYLRSRPPRDRDREHGRERDREREWEEWQRERDGSAADNSGPRRYSHQSSSANGSVRPRSLSPVGSTTSSIGLGKPVPPATVSIGRRPNLADHPSGSMSARMVEDHRRTGEKDRDREEQRFGGSNGLRDPPPSAREQAQAYSEQKRAASQTPGPASASSSSMAAALTAPPQPPPLPTSIIGKRAREDEFSFSTSSSSSLDRARVVERERDGYRRPFPPSNNGYSDRPQREREWGRPTQPDHRPNGNPNNWTERGSRQREDGTPERQLPYGSSTPRAKNALAQDAGEAEEGELPDSSPKHSKNAPPASAPSSSLGLSSRQPPPSPIKLPSARTQEPSVSSAASDQSLASRISSAGSGPASTASNGPSSATSADAGQRRAEKAERPPSLPPASSPRSDGSSRQNQPPRRRSGTPPQRNAAPLSSSPAPTAPKSLAERLSQPSIALTALPAQPRSPASAPSRRRKASNPYPAVSPPTAPVAHRSASYPSPSPLHSAAASLPPIPAPNTRHATLDNASTAVAHTSPPAKSLLERIHFSGVPARSGSSSPASRQQQQESSKEIDLAISGPTQEPTLSSQAVQDTVVENSFTGLARASAIPPALKQEAEEDVVMETDEEPVEEVTEQQVSAEPIITLEEDKLSPTPSRPAASMDVVHGDVAKAPAAQPVQPVLLRRTSEVKQISSPVTTYELKPIRVESPYLRDHEQENDRSPPMFPAPPKKAPIPVAIEPQQSLPRAPVPLKANADAPSCAIAADNSTEEVEVPEDLSIASTVDEIPSIQMDLGSGEMPRPSSPLTELLPSQGPEAGAHNEKGSEQGSGDNQETEADASSESGKAEQDGRSEDTAFAQLLTSVIQADEVEKDESMETEEEDLSMSIIAQNQSMVPIELPLAVPRIHQGMDLLEVNDLLLDNHEKLEPFLTDAFAVRDVRRGEKVFRLRAQYKEMESEWSVHCNKLEKIRSRQKKRQTNAQPPPMTPSVDHSQSLLDSAMPPTPSLMLAPSGRANRRNNANSLGGYGDAARSEAEFLEILASLEDADMRDPNLRAMRTTATVPDMIIDEGETSTLQDFDDNNGLVTDPFEHYGLNKKPDVWTEDEIATFCRRYALYPKQFGKIAAPLADKTTAQCVLFYYRSKKKIDFRALVDKKAINGKRKRKKGTGDKEDEAGGSSPDKKKGTSLLSNLKRSKEDEADEEDEEDEPQTPGSAIAAAAAAEAAVMPAARALIDQLNSEADEPPTRPASKTILGPTLDRKNSSKKAARFLSPPLINSPAFEDGVAPPSDGAIAAAEALGVLAGLAEAVNQADNTRDPAAKKKRKPSVGEALTDVSFDEDASTPKAGPPTAKRARPHSSSYWSVAEKNEFSRLLGVHGKDYHAIADGIESKTAVQCKNFFQNNVKKLNLAEIAAEAEGKPEGDEVPSVFIQPSIHGAEPAAGYFSPHAVKAEREPRVPSRGGMHLHNLLDDAPDAEGGTPDPFREDARSSIFGNSSRRGSDNLAPPLEDSSTEDEAEPAGRYASSQMPRPVPRRASDIMPLEYAHRKGSPKSLPADPALVAHQQQIALGHRRLPSFPSQQPHHSRSFSDSLRRSPVQSLREQVSSPYPSVLTDGDIRYESVYNPPPTALPPFPNGRYSSIPAPPTTARPWSPYDSPTYGQQAPIARDYYSSRAERYEDGLARDDGGRRLYLPPTNNQSLHHRHPSASSLDAARHFSKSTTSLHHTQTQSSVASPYMHSPYYEGLSLPAHHHTSSARSSVADNRSGASATPPPGTSSRPASPRRYYDDYSISNSR